MELQAHNQDGVRQFLLRDSRLAPGAFARRCAAPPRLNGVLRRHVPTVLVVDYFGEVSFGPTRLNAADYPSRSKSLPLQNVSSGPVGFDVGLLHFLGKLPRQSVKYASWALLGAKLVCKTGADPTFTPTSIAFLGTQGKDMVVSPARICKAGTKGWPPDRLD